MIWTLKLQFGKSMYKEIRVTLSKLSELQILKLRHNCYIDLPGII